MWPGLIFLACSLVMAAGECQFRDGMLSTGSGATYGCLTCTCMEDSTLSCHYPSCNASTASNPCLQYTDGCCAECQEYGCYNWYASGENLLVPIGSVPHPDPCMTCTCALGHEEVTCSTVMCQQPSCSNYQPVSGTCCEYTCPEQTSPTP